MTYMNTAYIVIYKATCGRASELAFASVTAETVTTTHLRHSCDLNQFDDKYFQGYGRMAGNMPLLSLLPRDCDEAAHPEACSPNQSLHVVYVELLLTWMSTYVALCHTTIPQALSRIFWGHQYVLKNLESIIAGTYQCMRAVYISLQSVLWEVDSEFL